MKTNEIIRLDEMSVGVGGLDYEGRVLQTVRQVIPKFRKYVHVDPAATAGYSNVGVDLQLEVAGKPFHVEIKMNTKAQMGGTSMLIDLKNDTMRLKNPENVDPKLQELYFAIAKTKLNDFRKLVAFFKKNSPPQFRKKLKDASPPGAVPAEVWDKAVAAGYMKRLTTVVPLDDVSSIANHYNKKGVYYIQIGGAGLFYLNKNPLKLPIPKFESPINIELEFRRGGGATKTGKSSGGYRLQGRLLNRKIKSSMTLDDPAHVAEVFQTIINGGATTTTTPVAPTKAKAEPKPAAKVTKKSTAAPDLKAVKSVGTMPKIDPKQKAKAALASGGKSKKG